MNGGAFTAAIIGTGLIGGSFALALRGFRDAKIVGADADGRTREKACDAFDEIFAEPSQAVKDADIVLLCAPPETVPEILRDCAEFFKPGAVVADMCGVKSGLLARVGEILREKKPDIDYISCHPMAGREAGGFERAEAELFLGTSFLLIPAGDCRESAEALLREMASFIGASRIERCPSPAYHDGLIAHASHLCHISAAALCLSIPPGLSPAYTGGAWRDCTRIAEINAGLWSGLLLENRELTLEALTRFEKSLRTLRTALDSADGSGLKALLESARGRKREAAAL
jgi:prephenate dehydrogenase